MLRLLMVLFILCIVAAVLAIKYLPLWAIAIGAVVLAVVARYLGGYLLKQAFLAPFKAKGRVLHNAAVTVHGITAAEKPARVKKDSGDKEAAGEEYGEHDEDEEEEEDEEDEEDEEYKDCRYYAIDVTIKPQQSSGPFRSWDPFELNLVEYGKKINADNASDECGGVIKVQVFHEGQYHEFAEDGPQSDRFRFIARVKPGPRRLAFQYYFESFGDLTLPE